MFRAVSVLNGCRCCSLNTAGHCGAGHVFAETVFLQKINAKCSHSISIFLKQWLHRMCF